MWLLRTTAAIGVLCAWLQDMKPPAPGCSSKHIINCFQHITESCDALHSPCGGAPQQRCLSTLTSRATHAHPTSPRSTGFCAIWGCISSSCSPSTSYSSGVRWKGHNRTLTAVHAMLPRCSPSVFIFHRCTTSRLCTVAASIVRCNELLPGGI